MVGCRKGSPGLPELHALDVLIKVIDLSLKRRVVFLANLKWYGENERDRRRVFFFLPRTKEEAGERRVLSALRILVDGERDSAFELAYHHGLLMGDELFGATRCLYVRGKRQELSLRFLERSLFFG